MARAPRRRTSRCRLEASRACTRRSRLRSDSPSTRATRPQSGCAPVGPRRPRRWHGDDRPAPRRDPQHAGAGRPPTKRPRAKSTAGLHPDTVAALRRRRVEQSEDRLKMGAGWPRPGSAHDALVFTWAEGTANRPSALTRIIARLSVAAGLPRLTPRPAAQLRHSDAQGAGAGRGRRRPPREHPAHGAGGLQPRDPGRRPDGGAGGR